VFTQAGRILTLYDPCCGTGGMLTVADEYVREHAPGLTLKVFGQEYNPESHAICGSDMIIKGEDASNIVFGDTLGDGKTGDGFRGQRFHYMLANPPFGVEWKPQAPFITKEHEDLGFAGRFGPGLPRINDGALLFLLHMISKMRKPEDGGSRIGIVFNGSPLFTGDAGSGESRSAAGSSRTTGWRPSSACRIRCSTTPASSPTSGS
jgi:type I restriction enzyme M protein